MPQGYHEPKDPRTDKAPEHQKAALKAARNISNAEILPEEKPFEKTFHAEVVDLETLMRETNAFIVGGYVRDTIMGIEPHDLDLASPKLSGDVENTYAHSYAMGFGTTAVRTTDHGFIEITTFRKESGGRHPEFVSFTDSLEIDLGRRDFTINAMAMDKDGNIIDYYGGVEDIKGKLIRTIYDPYETLDIKTGDPLRAIRALRFSQKLGFTIDPILQDAIRNVNLSKVSGWRIHMELTKMFEHDAAGAIEIFNEYGILKKVLPEVFAMHCCKHNPEHHPEGNCYQHTLRTLDYVQDEDMLTKMCALLHDVGKPMVHVEGVVTYHGHDKYSEMGEKIMDRLGRPKVEQKAVGFVIKNHMKMHDLEYMKPAKRRALYDSPYFPILLKVVQADSSMRGHPPHLIEDFVKRDMLTRTVSIKPLLDGHTIMKYGIAPGPIIREIQDDIVEQQIEGKLTTEREALNYFKRKYV